jgi:hypothetical protein
VIRAVLGFLIVVAVLFMADQEFTAGRYTLKAEKVAMKIKKAVGI